MRLSFSLSAALLGFATFVTASNVVDLTSDNFDQHVGKDKGALVEFFAPWCGHCKNLAPTYEQLADAFPSDKVVIAKTDADGEGRELGSRFEVRGYPTLKWFPAGSSEPVEYSGGRDLDALAAFVTEQSGVKSNIKPPPPPAAVVLDGGNFYDVVDGSKHVLVAFTAPWCGHCKNMKPAYEAVARAFLNEDDVVVAQVNADDMSNKEIAQKYEIRSFPTIKFFPKGASVDEPEAYSTGRSEEQFVNFLNEKAGTNRSPSGLLNDLAGKVQDLDKLAYQYYTEAPSREEIYASAKEYVTGLAKTTDSKIRDAANYYVKAMERIQVKGDEWLTKEQARLANLLKSPSLAPTKLDEIKIKGNILTSFLQEKIEDAADEVEDKDAAIREKLQGLLNQKEEL